MTPLVTRLQPGNGHPGSSASKVPLRISRAVAKQSFGGLAFPSWSLGTRLNEIEIPN